MATHGSEGTACAHPDPTTMWCSGNAPHHGSACSLSAATNRHDRGAK